MSGQASDPLDQASDPLDQASDPLERSGLELLVAPMPRAGWRDNLALARAAPPWAPFAGTSLDFVGALTGALLADRSLRRFPDILALAHGLRPVEIRRFSQEFQARGAEGRRRWARGLVFHIAPANVATLFAYSWLLALLAGNTNVVRLSRRGGPAQAVLVEAIGRLLAAPEWAGMRERVLILAYGRDETVTAAVSAACDLRVVWGGDASILALRQVPLPAGAQELSFPDRVSAALIAADAVIAADPAALASAAEGLVNDVIWFDQNACASPRLLVWVGGRERVATARARFWPAFDHRLAALGWSLDGARTQARLVAAAELAARGRVRRWSNAPGGRGVLRGEVGEGGIPGLADHPGLGLILEDEGADLAAAGARLPGNLQTLACFGLELEAVATATATATRRVDRLAPLGQALAFSPDWDGQDLFERFTRSVRVGA